MQWNPGSVTWGTPKWGHVISHDLVRWKHLPVALFPTETYDEDGVFSGSAGFSEDNTPLLYYTGSSTLCQAASMECSRSSLAVQTLEQFWQLAMLARRNQMSPRGILQLSTCSVGVSMLKKLGYYYQQTALAVPADLRDPELKQWVKAAVDPLDMHLPSGATHAQFRDPFTPRKKVSASWVSYLVFVTISALCSAKCLTERVQARPGMK